MAIVIGLSMQAHADLNLIGQGTSTHGTYNLIYDTDLDITWYDYRSPYDRWQNQVDWADALSVTFNSITDSDWRLPIADDACSDSYNCTNNEMSHLYYAELGNNIGWTQGCTWGVDCGLLNTGDFQNLIPGWYWSGTEVSFDPTTYAWGFRYDGGYQDFDDQYGSNYALAVRDGMAGIPSVVPEPISSTLFLVGGATLGFRRFRKNFKK